jgi:hypothetical protein
MRAVTLVLLVFLGGCSIFDSASSGSSQASYYYDQSKVYLGRSAVMIPAREVDHYACIGQPLLCERWGSQMQCRCMY